LISFDLDGVLQRNPFLMGKPQGVFGHISRVLAPYVDDPEPERVIIGRIVSHHRQRLGAGDMVGSHDWDDLANRVAREVGYPGRIDVGALVAQYCQVDGLIWAYPGSAECMDALLAQGHTLVSVTNGFRAYQEPVQRALGLLSRFTALVTPDAAGAGKPQPEIFRAAEAYGPGPYIHIGDVLPHDIAGAKGAGWLAIHIVQPKAPSYTPMPPEMAQLKPWQRPAVGRDWLQQRLTLDRHWHEFPHCELEDCTPDAVVDDLLEIPETVAHLIGR